MEGCDWNNDSCSGDFNPSCNNEKCVYVYHDVDLPKSK